MQNLKKKNTKQKTTKRVKASTKLFFQYNRNKKLWESIGSNDSPGIKAIAEKLYEFIALAFIVEEHNKIPTREPFWVRERITGEKNLSEIKKLHKEAVC